MAREAKEVRLDLGATPDEVNRLAAAVAELAAAEAWPEEMAFQVTLALEEVAMNIINYAYPEGTPAASQVALKSEADKLTITITDQGKPFNPLEDAPAPDLEASLEDRQVGGLGIHLARSLMDEAHYARQDGANRLTMVKLKPKAKK